MAPAPLAIAQLIETDGPGGAEMVVLELSRELRRRGHRVVALGPSDGEGWLSSRFRDEGFERQGFRVRRALDPGFLGDLARRLRELRVDVVHSHEFTCAVYGAVATRRLGIPQVMTLHGDEQVTRVWRRRAALRFAMRFSAACTTVSTTTRDILVSRLGRAARRLEVVPNGVPVVQADGSRVRQELGLAADDLLVLAVGNLYERKGHRVLLDAVHRVAVGTGRQAHLAIAGRGREHQALAQRAAELGMAGHLHLLGVRDDVPALLAAADVFAMPSYWEGMPLALLEAMLAGRPCLASRVGGIPEVIPDEGTGLLVPEGDPEALAAALARLLDDPELRRRLGRAARERALARYSLPVMTDTYEALYRDAVAPR